MKYNIAWNADKNILTIQDTEKKTDDTNEVFSHLEINEVGDVPSTAIHPAPRQHLENLIFQKDLELFQVEIVNDTGNELLDKYNKKADKEATRLFMERKQNTRVENTGNEGRYGDIRNGNRDIEDTDMDIDDNNDDGDDDETMTRVKTTKTKSKSPAK